MSGTTDTANDIGNDEPDSDVTYVLGITFAILILLITLFYASYRCNRSMRNSSSPIDDRNRQLATVSRGIDDDVLVTFPVFVYSEDMMHNNGNNSNGSGCSICLADYKAKDGILPECRHLFHVKCIDRWLKVHASCPVCRNSPLPVKVSNYRFKGSD